MSIGSPNGRTRRRPRSTTSPNAPTSTPPTSIRSTRASPTLGPKSRRPRRGSTTSARTSKRSKRGVPGYRASSGPMPRTNERSPEDCPGCDNPAIAHAPLNVAWERPTVHRSFAFLRRYNASIRSSSRSYARLVWRVSSNCRRDRCISKQSPRSDAESRKMTDSTNETGGR